MKKQELGKLALLGVFSGMLAMGQPAAADSSINVDTLLARPSCNSKHGCGGLTADRDLKDDKADEEDVDEDDSDDADEANEENTKKDETTKKASQPVEKK